MDVVDLFDPYWRGGDFSERRGKRNELSRALGPHGGGEPKSTQEIPQQEIQEIQEIKMQEFMKIKKNKKLKYRNS